MTAVLDSFDIEFLEKEVSEFEQQNGTVLSDWTVTESFDCNRGTCWGMPRWMLLGLPGGSVGEAAWGIALVAPLSSSMR